MLWASLAVPSIQLSGAVLLSFELSRIGELLREVLSERNCFPFCELRRSVESHRQPGAIVGVHLEGRPTPRTSGYLL